jgi:hypothetical protein
MKRQYERKLARTGAGILTTIALVLGAASAAAGEVESYRVAAIKDTAYGNLILREEFDTAIERLERRDRKGMAGFYTATNLCVAYIKTASLESAEASCALAVDTIEAVLASRVSTDTESELKSVRRFLALALSNRGVMHAVTGRDAEAQADFEAARSIESRLKEPSINLARHSASLTPGG